MTRTRKLLPVHSPPPLETVLRCVHQDARQGLPDAWAFSTVIDENVGDAVVDEPLFRALHEAAGIDARFPIGNAGLLHVYGYLFSTVPTPYGYKSDRWMDGVLATRLGLAPGAFRLGDDAEATPVEATPLARVTDAALPLLTSPPAAAHVHDQQVGDLATRAVVVPAEEGTGVLISGTDDGDGLRLVTIFPVEDAAAFAADLLAAPPRLRWNAAPRP